MISMRELPHNGFMADKVSQRMVAGAADLFAALERG
jgi:hypothetical protein